MILKELQILSKEYGLEVNFAPGKTEIMALGKKETIKRLVKNIEDKTVAIVDDYKYLGSMLSSATKELDRRISMAWKVLVTIKPLLLHNLTVEARI